MKLKRMNIPRSTLILFFASFLCLAVTSSCIDPNEEEWFFHGKRVTRPQYEKMLRDRIDLQGSIIVLKVEPKKHVLNDVDLMHQQRYAELKLHCLQRLDVVLNQNGYFQLLLPEVVAPWEIISTSKYISAGSDRDEAMPYVEYDIYRGKYYINSNEIPTTHDELLSDSYYIDNVFALLHAIGAQNDEIDFHITSIEAMFQNVDEIGIGQPEIATLEKITYVHRSVQGLPVVSDRMIFSYHLDGRLRQITGRWSPIDYNKSQYSSSHQSIDEIIDLAIDRMIEERTNPFHRDEPITINTVYKVENDGSVNYLDMVVEINASASNGGGGFVTLSYLMDI